MLQIRVVTFAKVLDSLKTPLPTTSTCIYLAMVLISDGLTFNLVSLALTYGFSNGFLAPAPLVKLITCSQKTCQKL